MAHFELLNSPMEATAVFSVKLCNPGDLAFQAFCMKFLHFFSVVMKLLKKLKFCIICLSRV